MTRLSATALTALAMAVAPGLAAAEIADESKLAQYRHEAVIVNLLRKKA